MKKLSKAQQRIINVLQEDETAYIIASTFWNDQTIIFKNGKCLQYFNRRTRQVLAKKGLIRQAEGNYNRYDLVREKQD